MFLSETILRPNHAIQPRDEVIYVIKRNIQNLFCSSGLDIGLSLHFFFHCATFNGNRDTLPSTLNDIDCKILESADTSLTQTLLFDST